jgi:hypothetical protein
MCGLGGFLMKIVLSSMALLCAFANIASADIIDAFFDGSNGQTVAPTTLSAVGSYSSTSWIFGEVDALPTYAGVPMYANGLGVTNTGPDTFDVSLFTGIWAANGAGGGPGTLLEIANTHSVTLPPGSFFFFAYSNFPIPSGNFWMGYAFDNALSPATTAAELGELHFREGNAPSIGTTSHNALLGTAVGPLGSNPVIGTTLPGNNEQFIQVLTPEPRTTELLIGGLLVLLSARRRK